MTIVTIEAVLVLILIVGVWMWRQAPPDDADEQQDQ
jgi:hypothetical protein